MGQWPATALDLNDPVYGRRGQTQRELATYFDSLEAAWPQIRKHIRTRIRHGYRVVGPAEYREEGPET